jgi:hypothetical protein
MNKILYTLFVLLSFQMANAQDDGDLLSLLGEEQT